MLESIRDLMNEQTVMPDWLHDIFLGYGDPAQAKYTHMPQDQLLQTIDFKVQCLSLCLGFASLPVCLLLQICKCTGFACLCVTPVLPCLLVCPLLLYGFICLLACMPTVYLQGWHGFPCTTCACWSACLNTVSSQPISLCLIK